MKRILLCSDTHGDLRQINSMINVCHPDLVFHAGDFGFYKDAEGLNLRELQLMVRHADVEENRKPQEKEEWRNPDTLRGYIQSFGLFSDFHGLIHGDWKFQKPVFATWGNHECSRMIHIVRGLDDAEMDRSFGCANLHVLRSHTAQNIGKRVILNSVGGNFVESTFFNESPYMKGGKVHMHLGQWRHIIDSVIEARKRSQESGEEHPYHILMLHVSPGRHPLLEMLIHAISPDLVISGHMGTPVLTTYNHFGLFSPRQLIDRWNSYLYLYHDVELSLASQPDLLDFIGLEYSMRENNTYCGEQMRESLERKTKKTWFINLPDARKGAAILHLDDAAKSFHVEPLLPFS